MITYPLIQTTNRSEQVNHALKNYRAVVGFRCLFFIDTNFLPNDHDRLKLMLSSSKNAISLVKSSCMYSCIGV